MCFCNLRIARLVIDIGRLNYLLISHFILNLQEISRTTQDDLDGAHPSFWRSPPAQSYISSIRFTAAEFVGNMGAPLRHGTLEDGDDVEDDIATVKDDDNAKAPRGFDDSPNKPDTSFHCDTLFMDVLAHDHKPDVDEDGLIVEVPISDV